MSKNMAKDHFILSIIAVIVSCLTGFFTIPIALAALIFSLRIQDLNNQQRSAEAASLSRWAAVFGWLTIFIALIPVILFILFGGAIIAFISALIAAA